MLVAAEDVLISVKNIIKNIRRKRKKTNSLRNGATALEKETNFHADIAVALKLHRV